jgi:GTPase Era involved in 16S rRNA processing
MKKAGLNPMLAYQQGGAGTPAGAAGQGYTAPVRNSIGEAVSAYQAAKQTEADTNLKNVAAINTNAQTSKIQAEVVQIGAMIEKILADTKVSGQTYKNLQETLNQIIAQTKLTTEQIKQTSAQTGKTAAETINIKENVAPSTDPYWYRDLKKNFPTPSNIEKYIRDQYMKYRSK